MPHNWLALTVALLHLLPHSSSAYHRLQHETIGIINLINPRSLDFEIASVAKDKSTTTDVRGVSVDANRQRRHRFNQQLHLTAGDQWATLRVCIHM